jgi:Undecaprenyl-phosphate galactose phosphotransferase WbaP
MAVHRSGMPAAAASLEGSALDAMPVPVAFRERWWIPFLLVAVDVAALEACLYAGLMLREAAAVWFPIEISSVIYKGLAAGLLVVPVAYYLLGLYPGYGIGAVERLRRRVAATTAVFAILIGWDYLVQGGSWSRGILLAAWVLATFVMPLSTAWVRSALGHAKLWGTPVVLIGTRETGHAVARNLRRHPELGLVPIGFLDDDPRLAGTKIEELPVLGPLRLGRALANRVRLAVLALPEATGAHLAEMTANLPFPNIVVVPDLAGMQSMWVSTRDIGGILGLEIKKNLLLRRNRVIKRMLDYVVGVPLFVLTLPMMLLFAAAVVLISPGSPFYVQVREGQQGRDIRVLKLRSMYLDADARLARHLEDDPEAKRQWMQYFKLRDDPRILPVIGDFMRRASLDELPQLINVLRGDMSLVGPRPFPEYHLREFPEAFRAIRQSVPPGLTGLWQVEARSDGDLDVQEALDSYYIRNWSLWLDLHILMRTFGAVVGGRGAR